MSAFKNDGTVQYGSQVLAIGTITPGNPPTVGSTSNYIADSFTVTRGSKTIERTNEIDEPSGQVSYITFVTGDAVVQYATSSTLAPVQGSGFSLTIFDTDGNGTNNAEVFYITDVGQPYEKSGEKKVNISFRKIVAVT